eukprot:TRINITY_DN9511_c0_g1_i2.p1 TRINITY_DN9511_c0_g1~~TRINITY_DN9511_c0_g1_i2.p1  ORF type:complete len:1124 (+),score=306.14 TRINITY_DN9511_c0_g1_i2:245-3616(+)
MAEGALPSLHWQRPQTPKERTNTLTGLYRPLSGKPGSITRPGTTPASVFTRHRTPLTPGGVPCNALHFPETAVAHVPETPDNFPRQPSHEPAAPVTPWTAGMSPSPRSPRNTWRRRSRVRRASDADVGSGLAFKGFLQPPNRKDQDRDKLVHRIYTLEEEKAEAVAEIDELTSQVTLLRSTIHGHEKRTQQHLGATRLVLMIARRAQNTTHMYVSDWAGMCGKEAEIKLKKDVKHRLHRAFVTALRKVFVGLVFSSTGSFFQRWMHYCANMQQLREGGRQLEKQAETVQMFNQMLARQLHNSQIPSQLLQKVAQFAQHLVQAQHSAIFVVAEDDQLQDMLELQKSASGIQLLQGLGWEWEAREEMQQRRGSRVTSEYHEVEDHDAAMHIARKALSAGRSVLDQDSSPGMHGLVAPDSPRRTSRSEEIPSASFLQALMAVPVFLGDDRVEAVIVFANSDRGGEFRDRHIAHVEGILQHARRCLANAKEHAKVQLGLNQLRRCVAAAPAGRRPSTAEAGVPADDRFRVGAALMKSVLAALCAEQGALAFVDNVKDELLFEIPGAGAEVRRPLELTTAVETVLGSGDAIRVDASTSPDHPLFGTLGEVFGEEVRSAICCAVKSTNDAILGLCIVANRIGAVGFSEADEMALELFGRTEGAKTLSAADAGSSLDHSHVRIHDLGSSTHSLRNTDDIQALTSTGMRHAASMMHCEGVQMFLYDTNTGDLIKHCFSETGAQTIRIGDLGSVTGLVPESLQDTEVHALTMPSMDPAFNQTVDGHPDIAKINNMIMVPLQVNGDEPLGLLHCLNKQCDENETTFSPLDSAQLQILAGHLAAGVTMYRMEDMIIKANAQVENLLQLAMHSASMAEEKPETTERRLAQLLEQLALMVDANFASMFIVSRNRKAAVLEHKAEYTFKFKAPGTRSVVRAKKSALSEGETANDPAAVAHPISVMSTVNMNQGILGCVGFSGKLVHANIAEDPELSQRFEPGIDAPIDMEVESIMSVPLSLTEDGRGPVLGVCQFVNKTSGTETRQFSYTDMETLQAASGLVCMGIVNRDLQNRARQSEIRLPSVKNLLKKAHLSLIHISEPTRLLSISYAVFCLKKKKKQKKRTNIVIIIKQQQIN